MLLLPSSSVPLWSVRLRECSKSGTSAALDDGRVSVTGLVVRAPGEPRAPRSSGTDRRPALV
ncbi:hypothetical protein [Streptomyces sp. NPDC002276]